MEFSLNSAHQVVSIEVDALSQSSPRMRRSPSPSSATSPFISENTPKERMPVKARRKKKKITEEQSYEEVRLEKSLKEEEEKREIENTMEFGNKLGLNRKGSEEAVRNQLEKLEKRDRNVKKSKVKKVKKGSNNIIQ